MNEPRKTRLTPEEQELRERLMRKKPVWGEIRGGSGKFSEKFWKLPKPKDPEGWGLRFLLEDRREGR
jgi:hypothetical protein